ncbi:MAG: type II secretion system F family protein [Chloroflexota bacterium]
MTLVGAVAAMVAVTCAVLATHGPSRVRQRLRAVGAPVRRVDRGTARERDVAVRVTGALAGAFVGCLVSFALPLGPVPVVVGAYVGGVAPSLAADRRAARERRGAEGAMVTFVEWLHALVACGRPLETAIAGVALQRSGSALLDGALARARRDYTLGVPMRDALAREGASADLPSLVDLAHRLERARDLGRGALPLLADLRDELRARERAQALEAASHVEGKLTLVLTLCYLPALALLVIIPLFLTLLAGLFA